MSTIPAKHTIKFLAAPTRVSGFSASGASTAVTAAITAALSTAGDGGVSVPLQVSSSNGLGVITSGTNNRVEIYDATSKDKILAANGEEVYGRLTESSGVYTLTYYTLPNTGTETSYSFTAATSIDFEFNYRFDFNRFPVDGTISIFTRNISQDPVGATGKLFRERLSPTAQNALPNLTKTPNDVTNLALFVNGVQYDNFGGASAYFSVNVSTKALTWSATNAGFNIDTTDRVIAQYVTNE